MELTPRPSRSSSTSSKANLDSNVSNLPPLMPPTPPSNTLLFTSPYQSDGLRPDTLRTIHKIITKMVPIHTLTPLKSLRRIAISFFDVDTAVAVQRVCDGEAVLGVRIRVYFGQWTPVQAQDGHLAPPKAAKLLAVSPPPSPLGRWDMRRDEAPNTEIHAEDLARTLSQLNQRSDGPESLSKADESPSPPIGRPRRSSSIVIYSPVDDGGSPNLPIVLLEDIAGETVENSRHIMAHTTRPPAEMMDDAYV